MSRVYCLYQEIEGRLKDLTPDSPGNQVRDALRSLTPFLSQLDEIDFEGLWANLSERIILKGKFFTALRREIGKTRKELKKSSPVQGKESNFSPGELQTLKPLAEHLFRYPDILREVVGTLNRMGLAGQEREAKIIYLALTSRIFERPVSVAVKGPSSGGKSFLVERCLSLFPQSTYYALSAMSEKALAYSQEPMSHRHLVIYEAAGLCSDFAQYLMRSLLSEGRIRYETVDKANEGMKSRLIEREGPTGLIFTTTKAGLHPENETRILSLEVDDSPKQTTAVLMAHAKGERQSLALGCNPAAVRLRRDFPMVLYLVKAHAALHFHSRQKDEQGRVIATHDDYRAVYDLVANLVAYGTGHRVNETVRETVQAVETLVGGRQDHPGVSIQRIADYLNLHKSTVSRRVKKALHAGYLDNKTKAPTYKLILGDRLPDDQMVLPAPEIIFRNSSLLETSAPLQPHKKLIENLDSYELQPPLQPNCNEQPTSPELHGCSLEIHHATIDATHNKLNLQEKGVTVAGLQGKRRDMQEKNLGLFSGEEFDL